MLLLSLDSCSIASAALSRDGEVLARFETEDTRSHAEALAPAVVDLLAETGVHGTALDGILVGRGPGPFTGLRAGLVTARTFGFAWDVPVVGMCSLDGLAHSVSGKVLEAVSVPNASEGHEFLVAIDARRQELYWRRYQALSDERGTVARPMADPAVSAPEQLPPLPAYGYGAGLYADRLPGAVAELTDRQPTAADLAAAAHALLARGVKLDPDTSPLYLRDSDAKVPPPRKSALGVGR